MTKTIVKARICWVPHKEGGRLAPPPAGTRYSPLVFFENVKEQSDTWSADFVCTDLDENHCSIVDFSYLFGDAPIQNLSTGNRFRLYEGPNLSRTAKSFKRILAVKIWQCDCNTASMYGENEEVIAKSIV